MVTGASRGIGAAYARALSAAGYDVLLVSRDKPRLEALASELSGQYGIVATTAVMDLSETGAAHRLFTAARSHRDAVDLLINNAGFGLYGPFVETPMARIQEMLCLHINTIVESMRLFLPGMIERGSGGIINVASTAGFFPVPYLAEYAATKAFLITLSESMAEEVRPYGVKIQACCPGTTETDFHAAAGFRPRWSLGTATPAQVVARSLSALRKGQVVVTIGWNGRLLALLGRWAPRRVLARGAAFWMRPELRDLYQRAR